MPLRSGTPMPELSGATEWIAEELSADSLLGSPTLVHFWAVSCPICHDNMPTVAAWRDQYANRGLKVVAIHQPRQEEDTNLDAEREDYAAMQMAEPCAIDNRHAIGERFENNLWPAYYLFDDEGKMRGRAAGYAGLKMIETPLLRLMEAAQAEAQTA